MQGQHPSTLDAGGGARSDDVPVNSWRAASATSRRVTSIKTPHELAEGCWTPSLIASEASIEAALESVKLFEGICQGGCDLPVRSRYSQ